MTFSPKNWENSPVTTTPLDATALVDLEQRLSSYTDDETARAEGAEATLLPKGGSLTNGNLIEANSSGQAVDSGVETASVVSDSNADGAIGIDSTGVTNGQGLLYNSTTAKWEPGSAGGVQGVQVISNAPHTPYGAKGDGVTDDSAAFNQALSDMRTAGGGELWIPPPSSFYLCNEPLNANDLTGTVIRGLGSSGYASAKPELRYSGSGTSPFITIYSGEGVTLEHLTIGYNNTAFTGPLIDYDHSATRGADCFKCFLRGVGFDSATANYPAIGVRMTAFLYGGIYDCEFSELTRAAIYGNPSGRGGQYVVNTKMVNCDFNRCVSNPIYFLGGDTEVCSFDGMTFEQLASVGGPLANCCGGFEGAVGSLLYSPSFRNIWSGDVSASGGTLFKTICAEESGTIDGAYIGGSVGIGGGGSVGFDLKGAWTVQNVGIVASTGAVIFTDSQGGGLTLNLFSNWFNTGGATILGSNANLHAALGNIGLADFLPPTTLTPSSLSSSPTHVSEANNGNMLTCVRTGGATVVIDSGSGAAIGSRIAFYATTGPINITAGTGVTLSAPDGAFIDVGCYAELTEIAANVWSLHGQTNSS